MPRISDSLFDGVAFQFRTADEARARIKLGGSSFLVGRPVADSEAIFGRARSVPYLISNRHVVHDAGASVVSINRRDGGDPDIIELDPTDWHAHPAGDDLAAACPWPRLNTDVHKINHLREADFVTPAIIEEYDLGVGDEVFMIGRFVNHQGRRVNRPAVRFGNISMMLEDILVSDSLGVRAQNSFAVEMRSRTGFSGSPVCVYRTMATVLTDVPEGKQEYWGLLGVNWGHILDEEGENTWLNGVVPAWKISELLDAPPLQAIHSLAEQAMRDLVAQGGAAQSETAK